jgi:hypothetical protein
MPAPIARHRNYVFLFFIQISFFYSTAFYRLPIDALSSWDRQINWHQELLFLEFRGHVNEAQGKLISGNTKLFKTKVLFPQSHFAPVTGTILRITTLEQSVVVGRSECTIAALFKRRR